MIITTDDQTPKDTTEADSAAGVSCAAASGSVGRVKPPLGIMDEQMWIEIRMWELVKCLARYADQTEHSPKREWFTELRRKLERLNY